MDGLTIGVYGLYLILVGLNGNAGQLAGKVQDDAPKFLPWIIAIFVIAFVNGSSEAGRKITGPFIALLVIAFVLRRFDTLKAQSTQLWDMAANAKPAAPSTPQTTATQSDVNAGLANSNLKGPSSSDGTIGSNLSNAISRIGDVSTFLGLE